MSFALVAMRNNILEHRRVNVFRNRKAASLKRVERRSCWPLMACVLVIILPGNMTYADKPNLGLTRFVSVILIETANRSEFEA